MKDVLVATPSQDLLRREYELDATAFCFATRMERRWDKKRFNTVIAAMADVCVSLESSTTLERWLVDVFYLLTVDVLGETAHPSFPRPDEEYMAAAAEMLDALMFWLASGTSRYARGHVWHLDDQPGSGSP